MQEFRHQVEGSLKAPFIVDDDCDPAESVALGEGQDYDGGPVTAARLSFLSMSGFNSKEQEGNAVFGGYGATRPNQAPNYTGFAQPPFTSPYSGGPLRASHESQSQMLPLNSSQLEPRDSHHQAYTQHHHQFPNIIDPSPSHTLPEIVSFNPPKGAHGQKIYIQIRSKQDYAAPPAPLFSIMFYNKRCEATLSKLNQSLPYWNYSLESDIPPYDSTGCLENQVPLVLNMADEFGQSIGVVDVGSFAYEDPLEAPYQQYQPQGKRKRTGSESPLRSPVKRASQHNLRTHSRDSSSYYTPTHHLPASPPTPNFSHVTNYYTQYNRNTPNPAYSMPMTQPQTTQMNYPSYSSYPTITQATRSPASIVGTPIGKPVMPSSSGSSNPTLVRTSTIQQQPMPGSSSAVSHSFNPYSMYPNSKAVLKIDGDLDKMADDWTDDEWTAKRRLVQFRRSQTGSTITATFGPVSPEERSPQSICVSCIWWEEKQECFVTSVDTISLLESLVAVRFTVEEKNRIRRNLEGFRPLTVSKVKADSEEFFKVIMGFPNPKPRNIEKDVKVFPWKILAHALKKIISKYSASYSSTASALPTTVSYASGGLAEAGTDVHHTLSPRHSTTVATPALYQSSLTSPSMRGSAGPGRLSAGPQEIRRSVSQTGWQNAQQVSQQYSGNMAPSYGRAASIDYAAFLQEHGTSSQSMGAPHGGVDRHRNSVGSSVGEYKVVGYSHRASHG